MPFIIWCIIECMADMSAEPIMSAMPSMSPVIIESMPGIWLVGIEADVVVVEPTGSETQIVARIGQQDLIAVIRDRRPVKSGDKVKLRPIPTAAHVFDKETGKRLIN